MEQNKNKIALQVLLQKAVSNNICSVIYGCRFEYYDKQFTEMVSSLTLP